MKHITHECRQSFEKFALKGQQIGSPAIKLPTKKKRKPKPTETIKQLTPRTWNRNKYSPKVASKARRIK